MEGLPIGTTRYSKTHSPHKRKADGGSLSARASRHRRVRWPVCSRSVAPLATAAVRKMPQRERRVEVRLAQIWCRLHMYASGSACCKMSKNSDTLPRRATRAFPRCTGEAVVETAGSLCNSAQPWLNTVESCKIHATTPGLTQACHAKSLNM
jgi:hypothetical protein